MQKLILTLCLLVFVVGFWFTNAAQAQPIVQLQALTAKIDRLESYVSQANWQEIRSYIHGPLGEVRREVALLLRQLPSSQRQPLKDASQKFFNDLITLDFAALDRNLDRTEAAFIDLEKDFEKMLTSL